MRILLLVFVISFIPGLVLSQCGPELPAKFPIGGGLNGLSDYDQDRPFNDVFKLNRWISANTSAPWNYVAPTMDANGWPTQDFGTVVMTEMDSTMGGTYSLRFNGQATLTPIASGFTVQNQVYDAGTNTTTADLVYPASIPVGSTMYLKFTSTQFGPGVGGVKNIMIMKPGVGFNGPTFSTQFLNHLDRLQCLRFMDWKNTNGSGDSLWANRRLTTATTQSGNSGGCAWEYIIELGNTLHKDIWINVPHRADSNYIVQLAQLINTTLDTSLHVYIEHSNEVWNWGFTQATSNLNAAIAEVTANPSSPLNFDGVNDNYVFAHRRHATRTKLISTIFQNVMGTSALNNRFRVVFGTQLFGFAGCRQALDFINDYYGNPGNYFYGIAVAPYFNTAPIDTGNSASPQDVLDVLADRVDNDLFPQYSNQVDCHAGRAHYYGMKLLCYEAGPDTYGTNNINSKKLASQNPQIKDICYHFLDRWFDYGFDGLVNWFTVGAGRWNTQYGTWSITENYEYSYKLQALDSMLNTAVTVPSAGQLLPGNVDARKSTGYTSAEASAASFTPSSWKKIEEWLVRVPKDSAGIYTLQIETASASNNQKVVVSIDRVFLDTLVIANNGSTTVFVTSSLLTTPELTEGLHTLRLKYPGGNNFRVRNFIFDLTEVCVPPVVDQVQDVHSETPAFFPNPAISKLIFSEEVHESVAVYDILGNQVMYVNKPGTQLHIESLHAGIYFIQIGTNKKLKFVKM